MPLILGTTLVSEAKLVLHAWFFFIPLVLQKLQGVKRKNKQKNPELSPPGHLIFCWQPCPRPLFVLSLYPVMTQVGAPSSQGSHLLCLILCLPLSGAPSQLSGLGSFPLPTLLQEGGPLPAPESGLLSNTQK